MTATPDAIPPQAVVELLQRFTIPLVLKPMNSAFLLQLIDQASERLARVRSQSSESNQKDTV